ncbi:helix-turn-helix domain-containing protein [Vibrio maritimus]|uniref:helix-turn-helix domain-containing protein n=1 Tax=Vibrio maritimus TaxID=990268 RepID=UPI001F17746C|nr:AraC family transcriptional regulator [Vibrio maritimus]
MAYWIGKPTILLPKVIRDYLSDKFNLIEVNRDVSVITEPSQTFCFYFSERYDNDETLLMLLKICRNLSKSLILFHDASVPDAFLSSELVYAHVDINSPQALKKTSLAVEQLTGDSKSNAGDLRDKVEPHQRRESVDRSLPTESNVITTALDYIEKHFTKNIKESDVAGHCHLSTQYFSRIFHREVGCSFRDHLGNKRLEYAKSLLLSDDNKQISSIAYESGFNDVSYFSRVFKRKVGMSPGTFRNFKGVLKIN